MKNQAAIQEKNTRLRCFPDMEIHVGVLRAKKAFLLLGNFIYLSMGSSNLFWIISKLVEGEKADICKMYSYFRVPEGNPALAGLQS